MFCDNLSDCRVGEGDGSEGGEGGRRETASRIIYVFIRITEAVCQGKIFHLV